MDFSSEAKLSKPEPELRVAILYGAPEFEEHLKAGIGASFVQLVWEGRPHEAHTMDDDIDALVVNLDVPLVNDIEKVMQHVSQFKGVVIFNEAPYASQLDGWDFARWQRHLNAKLKGTISANPLPPITTKSIVNQGRIREFESANIADVWLLGASIGGPEAVRAFLGALKKELPIAFVLVQHMGEEFLQVLVRQLNQESTYYAVLAKNGMKLIQGMLLIAPADKRIKITENMEVILEPIPDGVPYSPCIDLALEDLTERFGKRLNTIIFSGMANDSIKGVKAVIENKGKLWVQTPETCVVSTMVDGAKKTGYVSFSGSPEELAENLDKQY